MDPPSREEHPLALPLAAAVVGAVDPQPYAAVFTAALPLPQPVSAPAAASVTATSPAETSIQPMEMDTSASTAAVAAAVAAAAAVPSMPPPPQTPAAALSKAAAAAAKKKKKKGGTAGAAASTAKATKSKKGTAKRTAEASAVDSLQAGFASAAAAVASTLAPAASATASAAAPVASLFPVAASSSRLPKNKRSSVATTAARALPIAEPLDPFSGAGVSLLAAHRSDGSAASAQPPTALAPKPVSAAVAAAYSPPVLIAGGARPRRSSLPSLSLPAAAVAAAAAPLFAAPNADRIDLTSSAIIDLRDTDPDGCAHPMLDSSGRCGSGPSSPCLITQRAVSPDTSIRVFAAAHSISPDDCWVSHAGPLEFVDADRPALGLCPPLMLAKWEPFVSEYSLVVEEWPSESLEEQRRAYNYQTMPKTCPKQLALMSACFAQLFAASDSQLVSEGMQRYRNFRPKHCPTTLKGAPSPLHPYVDFSLIARKLEQAAYSDPADFAKDVDRFWSYTQRGLRSGTREWDQMQALTHQCIVDIHRMEAAERKTLSDEARRQKREMEIAVGTKSSHDHDGPAYSQPGHVSERGAQDKIAETLFRCTREQEICDSIRVEQQKAKPPTRWEEKRGVTWKGHVLKAPSNSPPVPLNSPLSLSLSPPIVPSAGSAAATAAASAPRAGPVVKEFLSLSETDDDGSSDCEIARARAPPAQLSDHATVDAEELRATSPSHCADGFAIEETERPDGPLECSTSEQAAAAASSTQPSRARAVLSKSLLEEDRGPCPMDIGDDAPEQTRALSPLGPDESAQAAIDAGAPALPSQQSVSECDDHKSEACSLYDNVVTHYLQAPSVRSWDAATQQQFFRFATTAHDPNQRARYEQIKRDPHYEPYLRNLMIVRMEIEQLAMQGADQGEAPTEALGQGQSGDGSDGPDAVSLSESAPARAAVDAACSLDHTEAKPAEATHVKRRLLARRTPEAAVLPVDSDKNLHAKFAQRVESRFMSLHKSSHHYKTRMDEFRAMPEADAKEGLARSRSGLFRILADPHLVSNPGLQEEALIKLNKELEAKAQSHTINRDERKELDILHETLAHFGFHSKAGTGAACDDTSDANEEGALAVTSRPPSKAEAQVQSTLAVHTPTQSSAPQAAAAASQAASAAAPAAPRRSSRPSSFKPVSLESEASEESEAAAAPAAASAHVNAVSTDSSPVVARVHAAFFGQLTDSARSCKIAKLAAMAKLPDVAYRERIARLHSRLWAILVDRAIPPGQREARLRELLAELKGREPQALSSQQQLELGILKTQLESSQTASDQASAAAAVPSLAAPQPSSSAWLSADQADAPVAAADAASVGSFSKGLKKRKQASKSSKTILGRETDADWKEEKPLPKVPRVGKKAKSSAASSVASAESARRSSRNFKPIREQPTTEAEDEITNEHEDQQRSEMQDDPSSLPALAASSSSAAVAAAAADVAAAPSTSSDSVGMTKLRALSKRHPIETRSLSSHMELLIYGKLEIFGRDYETIEQILGVPIQRDLVHYLRRSHSPVAAPWERAGVPLPSGMLATGASYTVKPSIALPEAAADPVVDDDAQSADLSLAAATPIDLTDQANETMESAEARDHDDAWSATGADEERHGAEGVMADASDARGHSSAPPALPALSVSATSPTVTARPEPMEDLEHGDVESIALPASAIHSAPSTPATRTLSALRMQQSDPSKLTDPAAQWMQPAMEPISIPAAAPVCASAVHAPPVAAAVCNPSLPVLATPAPAGFSFSPALIAQLDPTRWAQQQQQSPAQQQQAARWVQMMQLQGAMASGLFLPPAAAALPAAAMPALAPLPTLAPTPAPPFSLTKPMFNKLKSKSKKKIRASTLQAEAVLETLLEAGSSSDAQAATSASAAAASSSREARAAARARSAAASPAASVTSSQGNERDGLGHEARRLKWTAK